jgi:hypothetical protein
MSPLKSDLPPFLVKAVLANLVINVFRIKGEKSLVGHHGEAIFYTLTFNQLPK